MDGIGRVGFVAQRPASGPANRAGGTGFRVATRRAGGTVASAAVSMPGLLGLQEAESGAVDDREARRGAEDMLDALQQMQRDLLRGGPGAAALDRAAALASRAGEAADPALRDHQRAVLVRVAVERARRDRSG